MNWPVILLFPLCLAACFSGGAYTGPVSDHFDGEKFHNRVKQTNERDLFRFLREYLSGKFADWPDELDGGIGKPSRSRTGTGELHVTFVNHATVLIQMDGLNILTDPIWSERSSPFSWIGPRRVRQPGVRFEDLPPIDVVLLSHNHYDHFDLPTLERIFTKFSPRVFTGLGNGALLSEHGITSSELDWGDTVSLSDRLQLTFVAVQHFSGRGLTDRNRTLWGGFVLSGKTGNVYFAGDTGYGPHFRAMGEKFGSFRLALLPIGAYEPRWFMRPIHINPEEAVRAHLDLKAQVSMAIHFGTFPLAAEGVGVPGVELKQALERQRIAPEDFFVPNFGEERKIQ